MKKFLAFILLLGMAVSAIALDDVDKTSSTPLRRDGGRMKNKSVISLGTSVMDVANICVLRPISIAAVADGMVVSNYNSGSFVCVTPSSSAGDMNYAGVACIRDGSTYTYSTYGAKINVAVAGDAWVLSAGAVFTPGEWVTTSSTAGMVTGTGSTTSALGVTCVGQALDSISAAAGVKIRVRLQIKQ